MVETIFDTQAVEQALDRMAAAMAGESIYLIGIQRGGSAVADALQRRLQARGVDVARGDLDISFYRDDLDTIGPNPKVGPSHIPFDVSGKEIWLVDDVLFTGRTVRAALGEIFDYGRPAAIRLAVLVDRNGRELPIAADLSGFDYQTEDVCSVKLARADGGWRIVKRRARR